MTATTPDALRIDGLTAGYGRTTVLREIAVRVGEGEAVALLGPNGAGKTTLLRAALGLVTSTAGTVTLGGADVTRQPVERRARAGMCLVREGRGVFPHLTVRENLLLQCPRGERDASIERAIAAFPVLGERLEQRAGTMSGGQQQMLALGRCFSTKPAVVLLDEVSMGLAPLVVDQIFDALAELQRLKVSVLLVEQYVGRALAMADRVYLLERGRIAFSGSPSDLTEEEIMSKYMHVDVAAPHVS
jgi:branched-chain amino acid transport system ATP-binding protein